MRLIDGMYQTLLRSGILEQLQLGNMSLDARLNSIEHQEMISCFNRVSISHEVQPIPSDVFKPTKEVSKVDILCILTCIYYREMSLQSVCKINKKNMGNMLNKWIMRRQTQK